MRWLCFLLTLPVPAHSLQSGLIPPGAEFLRAEQFRVACHNVTAHAVLFCVQLCYGGGIAVCSGSQNHVQHMHASSAVAVTVLDRTGERLLGVPTAPLEPLPVDDSRISRIVTALRQRR